MLNANSTTVWSVWKIWLFLQIKHMESDFLLKCFSLFLLQNWTLAVWEDSYLKVLNIIKNLTTKLNRIHSH